MVGVQKAGLAHKLKLDAITKGDNNCFFNAVFAQIRRPDVVQELAAAGVAAITNPHDLRLKVSKFAKRSKLAVVDQFKRLYYETYPAELWDDMWSRMEKDQEWADGITAQATAWFLHHDIHIVMASGDEKTIFGSWDRERASCDKTTLLLGYLNSIHYQSLLPLEEEVFSPPICKPLSFLEIIKMVSEAYEKENLTKKEKTKVNLEDQIPPKKAKLAAAEDRDWSFNFTWNSRNLFMKPAKDKGWTCPFCESEEKQIMRHIKGKHITSSQKQSFAAIEKNFNKHSTNKRKHAWVKKQMETDDEGFKRQNRKAVQDCRKRKKKTDKEGFRKRQQNANKKYKRKIGSSREAAVKRFYQEILYGPMWECVCCRILTFWHNVVVYDEKRKAQIRKKADEAHERDYNSRIKQVGALIYQMF